VAARVAAALAILAAIEAVGGVAVLAIEPVVAAGEALADRKVDNCP